MMCAGKVYCNIYRDKKYCRKEHEANGAVCDCRHSVNRCVVESCPFEINCHQFDVIMAARENIPT